MTYTLTAGSGCRKHSSVGAQVGELVTASLYFLPSGFGETPDSKHQCVYNNNSNNNNNTHHLHSTYYGPGSLLRTLHAFIHFVL